MNFVSKSQTGALRKKKNEQLDNISVITAERLRQFNYAHGTVAGNVTDELAAKEAAVEEADQVDLAGQTYVKADVEEEDVNDREEELDEVISMQQ